ncbi:MAG TPA: hypothetical protein DCY20_05395 [Firmicutes bacterium]|nr:hypothetical protein [Bacillota bacterium]
MKNIIKYPATLFFAIVIIGFSVLDIVYPLKTFSETENRMLAQMPEFSLEKLFNGTFTSDFETFTNDQFFARDEWITLKSFSEMLLQKIINNGIVYGKDNYLFDLTSTINEGQYQKNLSYLAEFSQMYADYNVSVGIIPNSTAILKEKLPLGFTGIDQLALLNEIESVAKHSQIMDLVTPLQAHSQEYIFYKTDHHWTTLGAYYAYEQICNTLGMNAVSLNTLVGHEVKEFKGTYFAKAKKLNTDLDTITYYDFNSSTIKIGLDEYTSLYDISKFEVYDKYSAFLYGNNGLTSIETPSSPNQKVLIIKDSYSNSLAPFLTEHYSTLDLVDLRQFTGSLSELITNGEYDDIIFLFSVSNFVSEPNIAKLRY